MTKSGLTDQPSSVDYSVAPNTAVTPGDYTAGTSALTGTLNFAAGVTTQTITLNITNDAIYELTENFNVNLTNAVQATISDAQGIGTILDNDTQPAFSINDVTVDENDGTITFTVTKTGLTAVASSVDYSVAPNTAVTPGDYTAGTSALTGTLNFAAGVTTQTITLNITDDSIYELTENFNVNLTNAVQATISDNQGIGTILDNDTISVTADSGIVWEEALDSGDVASGDYIGTDPTSPLESDGGSITLANIGAGLTIGTDYFIAVNGNAITADDTSITGNKGTLIIDKDGSWTYTLHDNSLAHTGVNLTGLADVIDGESFAITVEDALGTTISTASDDLVIQIADDGPTAISPQGAYLLNKAGATFTTGKLDFADGQIEDNLGADGGAIRFPISLESTPSNLTSGTFEIHYDVSANGLVLTGYTDEMGNVFTITLNPNASGEDLYTVHMIGTVDGGATTIDFNAGGYNFVGGNGAWAGFNTVDRKTGTDLIPGSKDLLLTPINGGTVNTTANTGGVGNSFIDDLPGELSEGMRVDFVIDLSGKSPGPSIHMIPGIMTTSSTVITRSMGLQRPSPRAVMHL